MTDWREALWRAIAEYNAADFEYLNCARECSPAAFAALQAAITKVETIALGADE